MKNSCRCSLSLLHIIKKKAKNNNKTRWFGGLGEMEERAGRRSGKVDLGWGHSCHVLLMAFGPWGSPTQSNHLHNRDRS